MNWIASAGGPLIALPTSLLPHWRGVFSHKSGAPTDYDLACSVNGFVGVLEKEGTQVLVLGDEPLQTAVARLGSNPCLVRWAYAPSYEDAEAALARLTLSLLRGPLESVRFYVRHSPLLIMDAGASGSSPVENLKIELASGDYEVSVCEFIPSVDMKFLVYTLNFRS